MKKLKLKLTPNNAPYYFMAPGVLLFSIFGVYPIIATFIYSFQQKMGTHTSKFIGFDNYIKAFSDKLFLKSLGNIAVIFIMHAPIMIFIALVLAYILNQPNIKCKTAFRTAYFLPNVTNVVAYTFLFKILFSNSGTLNTIIKSVGLEPIRWLSDPFLAKWLISIITIWRWTGYNMIILLAAMQNISPDVYEAASIDGANRKQQFFRITVPLMKNPLFFTTIMTVSGTLNIFAEAQLLNNGGPLFGTYTPALLIYNVAWKQYDFGYASALSYILSLIIILIALIQFNIGKEKE